MVLSIRIFMMRYRLASPDCMYPSFIYVYNQVCVCVVEDGLNSAKLAPLLLLLCVPLDTYLECREAQNYLEPFQGLPWPEYGCPAPDPEFIKNIHNVFRVGLQGHLLWGQAVDNRLCVCIYSYILIYAYIYIW